MDHKSEPSYEIPSDETELRMRIEEEQRRGRAQVLFQLVALVPASEQPTAIGLLMDLERIDAVAAANMRDRWLWTVQAAFARGKAYEVREACERTTGEPSEPTPGLNETLH
jgi:hypothetical protein